MPLKGKFDPSQRRALISIRRFNGLAILVGSILMLLIALGRQFEHGRFAETMGLGLVAVLGIIAGGWAFYSSFK